MCISWIFKIAHFISKRYRVDLRNVPLFARNKNLLPDWLKKRNAPVIIRTEIYPMIGQKCDLPLIGQTYGLAASDWSELRSAPDWSELRSVLWLVRHMGWLPLIGQMCVPAASDLPGRYACGLTVQSPRGYWCSNCQPAAVSILPPVLPHSRPQPQSKSWEPYSSSALPFSGGPTIIKISSGFLQS